MMLTILGSEKEVHGLFRVSLIGYSCYSQCGGRVHSNGPSLVVSERKCMDKIRDTYILDVIFKQFLLNCNFVLNTFLLLYSGGDTVE